MDRSALSTFQLDTHPTLVGIASISTPLYSMTTSAGERRTTALPSLLARHLSPNPHALLRLCFSIGKTASIPSLWTFALSSRGHAAFPTGRLYRQESRKEFA